MTALLNVVEQLAPAWWRYMTAAALQGAVVGGLLLTVVACGRRWPAPLKYALLVVALAKFALPPFAAMPLGLFSQFEVASKTESAASNESTAHSGADDVLVREPSDAMVPSDAPAAVAPDPNGPSVRQLVAWKDNAAEAANPMPSSPATPRDLPVASRPVASAEAGFTAPLSWRGWLLIAYLAGVSLFGVRLAMHAVRLTSIVHRAVPADAQELV